MSVLLEGVEIGYGDSPVLSSLDWQVAAGEHWAVTGPSGSGKSSLLHCLAGLLRPRRGRVSVGEVEVSRLPDPAVRRWRLRRCGMVFQFGDLVPELTVRENVSLPSRLLGVPRSEYEPRVEQLVQQVGIAAVADALPWQVSGGQMQRAAIARAIAHQPEIVLADEPTGALDLRTSLAVMDVLTGAAEAAGSTLIVVTHDQEVAGRLDHRLALDQLPVPTG